MKGLYLEITTPQGSRQVAMGHRPLTIGRHTDNLVIIGDALINFETYGFTFLPGKYCSNEKEMRRSLRKLLDYKAERMLFAHGTPILSRASERLKSLGFC